MVERATDPAKEPKPLPKFEGHQVQASRITVPNIGGGLNDALDVEPVALKHGQSVLLVVEAKVKNVDHVPYKGTDTGILARTHDLTATSVMIVTDEQDAATVRLMLGANADRIQRALDSIAGQRRIDDPEVPDDELTDEELKVRRALQGVGGKV